MRWPARCLLTLRGMSFGASTRLTLCHCSRSSPSSTGSWAPRHIATGRIAFRFGAHRPVPTRSTCSPSTFQRADLQRLPATNIWHNHASVHPQSPQQKLLLGQLPPRPSEHTVCPRQMHCSRRLSRCSGCRPPLPVLRGKLSTRLSAGRLEHHHHQQLQQRRWRVHRRRRASGRVPPRRRIRARPPSRGNVPHSSAAPQPLAHPMHPPRLAVYPGTQATRARRRAAGSPDVGIREVALLCSRPRQHQVLRRCCPHARASAASQTREGARKLRSAVNKLIIDCERAHPRL